MDSETIQMIVQDTVRDAASDDDRVRVRKLQSNLQRIDQGERGFYNVSQFQKLGLIQSRITCPGNDAIKRTEWILTPKARRYLNLVV